MLGSGWGGSKLELTPVLFEPTPRAYQLELFTYAKKQNVVVYLDTGGAQPRAANSRNQLSAVPKRDSTPLWRMLRLDIVVFLHAPLQVPELFFPCNFDFIDRPSWVR